MVSSGKRGGFSAGDESAPFVPDGGDPVTPGVKEAAGFFFMVILPIPKF